MSDLSEFEKLQADLDRRRDEVWTVYRPFDHATGASSLLLKTLYAVYSPIYETATLVMREGDTLKCVATGRILGVEEGYSFIKPFSESLRPYPSEVVYYNPKTVVVVLARAPSGVILTRRGNELEESTYGKLALPAGFQEVKDITWQNAAVREYEEETGIKLDPKNLTELQTITVERGKINLLFCAYDLVVPEPGPRKPDDEVLELVTVRKPIKLAFDAHTKVLREYLASPPFRYLGGDG